MISNQFYYYFTLLATILILSSCLDSNKEMEYSYSADAQVTSFKISSSEDSLKVLSNVYFSINQVSSAPSIFNRDSLPYLFKLSEVKMDVMTNSASGIKLHLNNPDSSYIWNKTDSVLINRLKRIEVFAQDGKTKKTYLFQLTTHQQDPDTIFWQNIENNYIAKPTDQVTVSNNSYFFTYHKTGNSIQLSTSPISDGESWTNQSLSGLPQDIVLKTIQNHGNNRWVALGLNNKVFTSGDGIAWTEQSSGYPMRSIMGKLPSYTKDSVLAVVKDGDKYKFAKTIDFSSMNILNEIPSGFPVKGFTYTTVKDSLIYSAKYLVVTGGIDIDGVKNNSVWVLQDDDNRIASTSNLLNFNVTGSSLFNYDSKIYLLTSVDNKNVFYTSTNYGVFWTKASSKQSLPIEFSIRKNQSVTVDSKNNIWIFGGESSNQSQLVEVWKGRINKLFVK